MQSVIFYQVNLLSYLRISIFVKALVNSLALLLDFHVASLISIHVLSVACLNYPLFVCDTINVEAGYCTLCLIACTMHDQGSHCWFFSTQICFFESIWVSRFNFEKSYQICFFEDKNLATTYSYYNSKTNICSGHCSVHMHSSDEEST